MVGGGRVIAVGPAASTTIPAGAQRIDATGKTIVPGFINAHAHLNVDRGCDAARARRPDSPAEDVRRRTA